MPVSCVTAWLLLFYVYAWRGTLTVAPTATYRWIKYKVILIIMLKVLSLHELLEYKYGLVYKIAQSWIIYSSDYMGYIIREHGSNLYL